jgi:GMP reductase
MILNRGECLDFDDVMIQPTITRISSRSKVNLEYEFGTNNITWKGVPIIASNMDKIGTLKVSKVLSKYKMLTFLHKYYTVEDLKGEDYDPEFIGISVGVSPSEFENAKQILKYNPNIKFICLDVANGYMLSFHDIIMDYVLAFPDKIVVAGNVVDYSGAWKLSECGATLIKCGIGSGAVCTTRAKTGVGLPQFTCIQKCVGEWPQTPIDIMSDGGCKTPGDIAKAFGAGAKFVMIGGMLAGHNETGTEIYGMSSAEAMNLYSGGVDSYRTSEGKRVVVESKGPLEDTIKDILGGLRSALSYTNSSTLREFIGNQTFNIVRRQLNNLFD